MATAGVYDKPVVVEVPVVAVPPPAFSDLAKAANDLINKDFYHANAAALEVKLKAPSGAAVTLKGTTPHDGQPSGSVEAKQAVQPGITATLTGNNAGVMSAKAELDNVISQGVKAEILSPWTVEKGAKGQKLSLFVKQPNFHLRAFGDYTPGSGAFQTVVDAVVGSQGFLVGGEAAYDVQKAAITRYSTAIGYSAPSYSATLMATNNMSVFSALYYQKVNARVEAGVKTAYDTKSSSTIGIELSSKYMLDAAKTSFAKAKINDRGIMSVAYNTKINKGVTLGLGLSFDSQKPQEPAHKVGASFTFES